MIGVADISSCLHERERGRERGVRERGERERREEGETVGDIIAHTSDCIYVSESVK